jgi:hypothetical protein
LFTVARLETARMIMMRLRHSLVCLACIAVAAIAHGAPVAVPARTVSAPAALIPKPTRDFWSFKKPVESALPDVKDPAWVRTRMDRFILAKLEEKGLAPSPEADRRTLIRRASFDLLGLPPTAQEVEAFVADRSPGAYEKLIDRLLASPRYGERWGRYWLDLARYSDTKGYAYAREERQFFHAHNYRDWVIAAFNEDMPYDRFLRLQIAGDQIGPADGARLPDDLAAMGFLTVGRRFLGVVPDIVDDRIDVTMRTTMGLTVGCARCHDHKFDPIPTADYYSLYGVFAGSTERTVCLKTDPERTEAYVKYEKGLKERVEKLTATFNARKEELLEKWRSKSGAYLAALRDLAKHPDDNFYTQLGADDLNPIITRQWQHYLYERGGKFDPIWAPWNALAEIKVADFSSKSSEFLHTLLNDPAHPLNRRIAAAFAEAKPAALADVAQIYGKVLTDIMSQCRGLAKDCNIVTLADEEDEALRRIIYAKDSPAHIPPGSIADTEWFFDEPTRIKLDQMQADIERWRINTPGAPPYALILEDRPEQKNPRIFKRGNPNMQGEEVTRHFPSLFSATTPPPFTTGSGRLELARAITSKDNPLTARVMVNRIWMHHFGAGLVTTASDFGHRSDPPSHPELLDWLAVKFMNEGWSIKSMHRLLMCSATYRQASADNSAADPIDPENRLLARMNRTRLDFEGMRDSLLAISGELDLTAGGKPSVITGNRRSIYAKIDRQFVADMVRVFDFACPDLHIPQRAATTVPQQALFFMNASFVTARAKALAARPEIANAKDDVERIQRLYHLVYQRDASDRQVATGLAFIKNAARTKPVEIPAPVKIVSPWKYGYGEYDPIADRVSFTPLPHFTGDAWQGGKNWPDKKLGWVQITAKGGHAGNDMAHAAVRRWVAPRDMAIRIDGEIRHEYTVGDGIAARLISSGQGTLGQWKVHDGRADAKISRLEVKNGDTVDFVVDFAGKLNSNMFIWAPVITALDAGGAPGESKAWTSAADFSYHSDAPALEVLDPWTVYAHVLLMSNEFLFVD